MDGYMGRYYIKQAIDDFGEKNKDFTTLRPNFTGYNPDEISSPDIPYEKGYNFVYYLEYLIGEEKMELFFKSYFNYFKYKSIDYCQFKNYFLDFCKNHTVGNEIEKINWTAWIFTPGDIPIEIPENNSYKKVADEIIEKIKIENLENLDIEFNNLYPNSKTYILLNLEYFDGFLTDKQHKFLTGTLKLYENQNFLVSTFYFQVILEKTDIFLEHELESLLKYLSNYGVEDYMNGIYGAFYKRDEIKAKETLDSLKSFYHSSMFNMAEQEIENAKEEFPILELNVIEDKNYYYPYDDIFELNVKEYNEDLGELFFDNDIYLVYNNSTELKLYCLLNNSFQFCKLQDNEILDLQGQFNIKVTERIQKLNYAVKIFDSNNFEIKQIINKERTKINYIFDIGKNNDIKIIINLNEEINISLPVYFNNDKTLNLKCEHNDKNYECTLNKTFCETHCNIGKNEEKKYQINVLSKSGNSFLNIDLYIKNSSNDNSDDNDNNKDYTLVIVLPCVFVGLVIISIIIFFIIKKRWKEISVKEISKGPISPLLKGNEIREV